MLIHELKPRTIKPVASRYVKISSIIVSPELPYIKGVDLVSVLLLQLGTFSPVTAVVKSYVCSQLSGIRLQLCRPD